MRRLPARIPWERLTLGELRAFVTDMREVLRQRLVWAAGMDSGYCPLCKRARARARRGPSYPGCTGCPVVILGNDSCMRWTSNDYSRRGERLNGRLLKRFIPRLKAALRRREAKAGRKGK